MVNLVTSVTWEAANGLRFPSFEEANKAETRDGITSELMKTGALSTSEVATFSDLLKNSPEVCRVAYNYHFASPSADQAKVAELITERLKDVATPVRAEETPGLEGIQADTIPRLP